MVRNHLDSINTVTSTQSQMAVKSSFKHPEITTYKEWLGHSINTGKFLIVIAPNSFIQYISPIYAGTISDKELTRCCGYLDMMEPYSEIMVDKGFNITVECAARRIYISVPPGKRGQSQMLTNDIEQTHKVANVRILVEQVISQLKNFRMLSHEIPLNMIVYMDDVLQICAAITNFQTPIYKW